ncbi:glutamate receptor -like [Olea europaea subsp. europaea]|uniref:Glutamate receptor n=1 Tax=Olea europaea subsp. europaea TaxID=158383 RepID=A0A8S0UR41_OLEEU|nr:glutamate receptor -like [Olea europaea subsp. europaea]
MIDAAIDLLRDVEVDAIIGPQRSTQVNFVMDLGDRVHVPIISFSATSPSLISRTRYFVRMAQSDAYQVEAIASIVKAFQWSQVCIISEDTEYGTGIIPYLSNALQNVNAIISYRSLFPKSSTDDFIYKELYKMMTMQTRVFVVHMSERLGARLFLKAKEIGMMSSGYAWIVTSGLTDLYSLMNLSVVEAMQGVLGVKPLIPKSKELDYFATKWKTMFSHTYDDIKPAHPSIYGLWAYDTLCALAMAAERVGNRLLDAANISYSSVFDLPVSETGHELLKEMFKIRFRGLAGNFSLTKGQIERTQYQIVNVIGTGDREVGVWIPTHRISRKVHQIASSSFSISKSNLGDITWPGGSVVVPKGWEFPVNGNKIRIGVPQKSGFNEFLKVEKDPRTNATKVSGYFKDVFEAVMAALPYAVSYEYVIYPFEKSDGSFSRSYDDLTYQVSLQENYDAAFGDITITANRSTYVDFSLPYVEGGVTYVIPVKYEDPDDKWAFLEPLTKEMWKVSAAFYIFTGLSIWILGRRVSTSSRGTAGQHAGMICYFPLFPGQGIEGTLICLILVGWTIVSCLLMSTYTASLSSKLTAQRLQPTVPDVKELIESGVYVGCQRGSFLVDFLKRLGFEGSKIRTYKCAEDCHEALSKGNSNGSISAYFDVMPHIMLFLTQFCGKYVVARPIHRTEGFGFVFPKSSPLVADVSRAIIQLTEKGNILNIAELKSFKPGCAAPDTNINPSSVTLRSFQVLFGITAGVTLACLGVSLIINLYPDVNFLQIISNFVLNTGSKFQALFRDFMQFFTSLPPRLRLYFGRA